MKAFKWLSDNEINVRRKIISFITFNVWLFVFISYLNISSLPLCWPSSQYDVCYCILCLFCNISPLCFCDSTGKLWILSKFYWFILLFISIIYLILYLSVFSVKYITSKSSTIIWCIYWNNINAEFTITIVFDLFLTEFHYWTTRTNIYNEK